LVKLPPLGLTVPPPLEHTPSGSFKNIFGFVNSSAGFVMVEKLQPFMLGTVLTTKEPQVAYLVPPPHVALAITL
jgi:hypothetical protein